MELVAADTGACNGDREDRLEEDPCLDRASNSLPSSDDCNDPCRKSEPRLDCGLSSGPSTDPCLTRGLS